MDHSVRQLLTQRIYGLALGYEDLNDHEQLRRDVLLAAACEKTDPLGMDRFNPRSNKEAARASKGLISLSQMKTPLTASSKTDCKDQPLLFQDLGSRQVVADFSGGTLSSDGGVLLLRQVDVNLGLTQALAQCFGDERQQVFVDHSVRQLLAQRIYGLALGYEDLNDHAQLRRDPLLAAACEKNDPLGEDRFNPSHRGLALAGPPRSIGWSCPTTGTAVATSCRTIRPRSKPVCCRWGCAACPSTPRRS